MDNFTEELNEPVVPDSLPAAAAMLEKVDTVLRIRLQMLTENVCVRQILVPIFDIVVLNMSISVQRVECRRGRADRCGRAGRICSVQSDDTV